MVRLAEALLEFETLDSIQIRRVVAGLPLDSDSVPSASPDDIPAADADETTSKNPFKKPILPPITGSNPATA